MSAHISRSDTMPDISNTHQVRISDVMAADKTVRPDVIETPLLSSDRLNQKLPFDLWIKADCLQRTGAFKFRGATNAMKSLPEDVKSVIAFSSGNHAQAVALAAQLTGRNATIIMPKDAPVAKIEGTRAYGADVVLYDRYSESREEIGERLAAEKKAELIRPFDDVRVIAGQGTAGMEVARQCAERGITPDSFICCCGGGGLISGSALALKHSFPDIDIHSAEPEGFDDTARSLVSGTHEVNDASARSICDAIVTPSPGQLTFPIMQNAGISGLVSSDEAVMEAMGVAYSYFKVTAEPGGAIALACALSDDYLSRFDSRSPRKTVIAIISGGNVDAEMTSRALSAPTRF